MEAIARIKNQKGSPRKVRLVADLIRKKRVSDARDILNFSKKRAARSILKILDSAVANAANKSGKVEIDKLYINKITVDEGITMKRWRSRAMGRADMIFKRTHHIALSVTDEMED